MIALIYTLFVIGVIILTPFIIGVALGRAYERERLKQENQRCYGDGEQA